MFGPKSAPLRSERLVGIRTETLGMAESLADACLTQGCLTVWLQSGRHVFVRGLQVCLWDFTHSSDLEFVAMSEFRAQNPEVQVIALVNFPRLKDQKRAQLAGATSTISKPLMLDDLFWTLKEVLPSGQEQASALRSPA